MMLKMHVNVARAASGFVLLQRGGHPLLSVAVLMHGASCPHLSSHAVLCVAVDTTKKPPFTFEARLVEVSGFLVKCIG